MIIAIEFGKRPCFGFSVTRIPANHKYNLSPSFTLKIPFVSITVFCVAATYQKLISISTPAGMEPHPIFQSGDEKYIVEGLSPKQQQAYIKDLKSRPSYMKAFIPKELRELRKFMLACKEFPGKSLEHVWLRIESPINLMSIMPALKFIDASEKQKADLAKIAIGIVHGMPQPEPYQVFQRERAEELAEGHW